MIVTLTPNPSVDLLFDAGRLVWDDANRVPMPRRRAGGQGINVARAVRALGGEARAVAPLGGVAGAELRAMLEAEGLPLQAVPIAGETRVFVGARERETGRSLLLNPRGPELSEAEVYALAAAVEETLRHDLEATRAGWPRPWLLCCGSLPPGAPPDLYARLGRVARELGARFAPDTDGEPLRAAVEPGCDLLAPNLHEAERLLDRGIEGVAEAGRAAEALLRFGPRVAAITLGAEGAVLATAAEAWHARAPEPDDPGSAVGAGDAFLGALLLELDRDAEPPDALASAVAAGTAVLRGRGGDLLDRRDHQDVRRGVRPVRLR